MSEHISVDRATIRAMTEDHFRHWLPLVDQSVQMAHQISERFYKNLEAEASLIQSEQAEEFIQVVGEESNIIIAECRRDKAALERRLGLSAEQVRPSHHRQSLADVAVRTAVRATVWESVDSLFRLFR